MITESVLTAVRTIVGLLVDGSYDVIEAMTRSRRLSSEDLRGAVEGFGRTLAPIPTDALEHLDVVQIEGADHPTLHVVVDLWTEEGKSDLSLELRLTDLYGGAYDIEVLDLHVL